MCQSFDKDNKIRHEKGMSKTSSQREKPLLELHFYSCLIESVTRTIFDWLAFEDGWLNR